MTRIILYYFKIKVVEFEVKRHKQWMQDLEKKKNAVEQEKGNNNAVKELEKFTKTLKSTVNKQEQLLRGLFF